MSYRCQSCGHKDDLEAFYAEDDLDREESFDEVLTCPECGDAQEVEL